MPWHKNHQRMYALPALSAENILSTHVNVAKVMKSDLITDRFCNKKHIVSLYSENKRRLEY
uniref:Uncharacterized protein n=1 Tax=Arion vulgaris TaxID=1028688 RepID=A0A0B7ATV7_9EUPU